MLQSGLICVKALNVSPVPHWSLLMEELAVPSTAALTRNRVILDMAACLFARRHVLDSSSKWYLHLRTDSSPQGGRDYLVSEYDWCKLGVSAPYVANMHVQQLLAEGRFGIAS